MFKKFSIMFLSVMFVFSVNLTSTALASSPSVQSIPVGETGDSKYKAPIVSATKTVRTHPEAFPADIAMAMVGLGGVYGWFTVGNGLSKFLAGASLSSTLVSRNDITTYDVTRYAHFLKKPTSTSAGYYQFKIKNNKTGKVEYTKAYNIGKNGV